MTFVLFFRTSTTYRLNPSCQPFVKNRRDVPLTHLLTELGHGGLGRSRRDNLCEQQTWAPMPGHHA